MDQNNNNIYYKILPFVVIVLLAVIGGTMISHMKEKKEEALLPTYNMFESKFSQIATGDKEDDVKHILGRPTSIYKEDKIIPRGPEKKWEYKIVNRIYTLSFIKNELIEEEPEWRVYLKTMYNPADAQNQEVDGYMIIKLVIILSCIYYGIINIKALYRDVLLKRISKQGDTD